MRALGPRQRVARHAALSVVVAALAVVAGCGGGETAAPDGATTETTATTPVRTLAEAAAVADEQVGGIAQSGLVLGNPKAPIEIVEYSSLDCEACAALHETAVPDLISRYVRSGQASLEFRPLVGTQAGLSRALGAFAASPQEKGWQMIQLQYARQAAGGSAVPVGPPDTPAAQARALGLDVARWREDKGDPDWATRLEAAENVWMIARWSGAPVFLVRRLGLLGPYVTLVQPTTFGELEDAIEEARAAPA